MAKTYKHQLTNEQKKTYKEQQEQEQEELKLSYYKKSLFRSIDASKGAKVPESYWGNWIVKNTLILQSGVGGVAKTSFNYAMFTSLQNYGEFLDVVGEQNLKLLYFDYEGSDSIVKGRLNLLGELKRNHPYFFNCNTLIPLTKMEVFIDMFIKDYWHPDIIVFDPFSLALEMENENDNVEATNKMKYMRECMRKWDTTIILVHHSAKADIWGVGNARGAGSQGNLADIVWEYHPLPKEFGDDKFVLRIPKNRELQDGFLQCIKKAEGNFLPTDFPIGFNKDTLQSTGIETYKMQQRIEVVMRDGKPRSTGEMIKKVCMDFDMRIESESALERCFYRSITPLLQRELLQRVSHGVYVATSLLGNPEYDSVSSIQS